jgi:hypothetical protein
MQFRFVERKISSGSAILLENISLVDDSLWPPIAGYITMNDFTWRTGELNKNRLTGGPLLELRFQKRI